MYEERNIKFKENITINSWSIKAYTISLNESFIASQTYDAMLKKLPQWLEQLNTFNPKHENISFVILHEASEGVFTLINTWVGENMLQAHVYLSKYDKPEVFSKISGDGLFACVWELEIINHERKAWIKHIMKNRDQPKYESYLKDILNTRI